MVTLRNGLARHEFTIIKVKLYPGDSDFGPQNVDLHTRIAPGLGLAYPMVSSAMDTVTGADLAIALAQEGGIGAIHYNMSPQHQVDEVSRVKRYEGVFIEVPLTVTPRTTIPQLAEIWARTGYSSFPVTDSGLPDGRLVGVISKNDYTLEAHRDLTVADRMKKLRSLTVIHEHKLPRNPEKRVSYVNNVLLESRRGVLPVVDRAGRLRSIVTRTDIERREIYPDATRDEKGRLRVLAAISTYPEDFDRARHLIEAGVDGIVIDTGHGDTSFVRDTTARLKDLFPETPVIAGNIGTPEAVRRLHKAGADCVKVGVGPGSICTTAEDIKVGVAQGTAIYRCAEAVRDLSTKKRPLFLIGDGGFTSPGDVALGLALGADAIMSGKIFAGTKESCGKETTLRDGRRVKEYRGMGSASAMAAGGGARYYMQRGEEKMPEGIEATVPYRGSLHDILPQFRSGIRQAFQKAGGRDIRSLRKHAVVVERTQDEIDGTKRLGLS